MKLYAVRVFVRDWDGACRFYGETLGLPERYRSEEFGWAEFDVGGPCFGIERVDADDPEAERLLGRYLGVSLQVQDVAAVCDALREQGVELVSRPELQSWGGSLAEIKDPEGNVITLLG